MSCGQIRVMYEGTTKKFRLRFTDDEGERVDLDEVEDIEFEVKRAAGAADPPLLFKNIGAGIELETQDGDTLGEAILTIDAADTTEANTDWIAPRTGVFYYDVIVLQDSGATRLVAVPPSELRVKALVNNVPAV